MSEKMPDISLDCETMGKRWDAPVISIGAVAFNRDTGKMGGTFHMNIDLVSALQHGRVDPETLTWWMRQSDEARQVFQSTTVERFHIATVLQLLTTFVRGFGMPRIYARGPQQDVTWLERLYDTACVGLKEGWHYQNVRCLRTIIDMAQIDESTITQPKVAHNALEDAMYQARIISAAYQKVGAALKGSKYHQGGIVGIRANEVPVILKEPEEEEL